MTIEQLDIFEVLTGDPVETVADANEDTTESTATNTRGEQRFNVGDIITLRTDTPSSDVERYYYLLGVSRRGIVTDVLYDAKGVYYRATFGKDVRLVENRDIEGGDG